MDPLSIRTLLGRTPGLTAAQALELVSAAGGDIARAIDPDVLQRVTLSPRSRTCLTNPDRVVVDSDLEWLDTSGVKLVAAFDPAYPPALAELPAGPPVLFVLGDPHVLVTPQIAMVGARNATAQGCRTARQFAQSFATAGVTVTSGLAIGIDAHSHMGALSAGGATVAVVATGLDRIYPTQHAALARRIAAQGALVSRFPPGTAPLRGHFPLRNELISGLSRATLVVEAAQRSGSLVTAAHARRQGRIVFALPGPAGVSSSAGCHLLIRAGAVLVEHPAQVLHELKIPHVKERLAHRSRRSAAPAVMDKASEMLLDAVGFEPATVDMLAVRTGLTGESIASRLLVLELQGHIASYPGGRYGRIPR